MTKIVFTILLTVCSLNMHAQFSGQGSGTEKDPYLVTNADELFEVRNDMSAYYKQMNDIDLEAWIQEESPVKGWPSIGTATAPFMGYYDGNNKAIKGLKISQPNTDKIGLFGVILEGEVKNLALINVQVEGGNDVGGLVGYVDGKVNKVKAKTTFSNIIIVGGNISGKQNVGSVVGRIYVNSFGTGNKGQATITGCFSSSQVNGVDNIGGIVGLAGSWNWGSSELYPLYITDNRYSGTVVATGGYAGGIWGKEYVDRSDGVGWKGYRQFRCLRNICGGTIRGTKGASGILGSPFDGTPDDSRIIRNNICVADTIATTETTPSIVNSVVFSGNYGLTTTIYYSKGKVVSAASDDDNIQLYGKKAFMRSSTYMGFDFDFNNQWAITEGVDFPYNITQSSPATVTEFVAGSRGQIKGIAPGTGKVYVLMGNESFESFILDGKWELTLGNTSFGTMAKVSIATNGLMPSVFVTATAEESSVVPIKTTGDANGDGVVDSADVTAIINYILGKPSASFNKENADVTGDGEILIDDAVQTVQLIMNAQ